MRFYKENKVNPFASCIPLVAQLPVFITLFYTLRHELPPDMGCPAAGHCAAYGGEFLFINDLTAKATGAELIVLIVLYVGTQLASGFFMSVTADKSQRTMMFVLPLVFVPFILSFPAGLILYWITTNFWTDRAGVGDPTNHPGAGGGDARGAAAIAAAKPPPPPPKKRKKRRR